MLRGVALAFLVAWTPEMGWFLFQAARGELSHFINSATGNGTHPA
jgi:hypothetical protein